MVINFDHFLGFRQSFNRPDPFSATYSVHLLQRSLMYLILNYPYRKPPFFSCSYVSVIFFALVFMLTKVSSWKNNETYSCKNDAKHCFDYIGLYLHIFDSAWPDIKLNSFLFQFKRWIRLYIWGWQNQRWHCEFCPATSGAICESNWVQGRFWRCQIEGNL